MNITESYCVGCFETKPIEKFYKCSRTSNGYQSYCIDCTNKAKKESRAKTKEKVKNENATFSCTLCDKTYALKDSLTRHIKEKHKN